MKFAELEIIKLNTNDIITDSSCDGYDPCEGWVPGMMPVPAEVT